MTPTALRGLVGAHTPNGKITELPRLNINTPALVPHSLDVAFKKLIDVDPRMTASIEISRHLVDQQARHALREQPNAHQIHWTLLDTLTDEDQTYFDHDKALIEHLKRLDAYQVGDEKILMNRKMYHGPDAWPNKEDQDRVWRAQCTPGLYQAAKSTAKELPFFHGRVKALQSCQALFDQMKAAPGFSEEFDRASKNRGLVVVTSPVNMSWAKSEKLAHGEFVKKEILPGARYIVDMDKASVQRRGEVQGGIILDDKPYIPPAKGEHELPFTHVRVETSRNQTMREQEEVPYITGEDFEKNLLPVVLPRVIVAKTTTD